ncbi:nucleotide pyrophosphohydrolase [Tenericutes bacterium MZ-XQ]|nr:nucleotide pyrophosphohydrolase [Tenericutes bacterium MZ-XQ]
MKDIIDKLIKFRDDRNWKQFHTPENIAKSIVLEAAELLENFQWKNDSADIENIKDEIADIMTYCLYMCETYELDMKTIINEKIMKNEKKYPVDKAFGKADKYNKL